ncbi:MAG TPA: aminotransferase class V-fold PLP-dependent enzyme [Kineosporiaceae bacterium]|nr:aminotransferase class V-fold PLP-dependent enzyme [Kineosporiaceae bacterium]
MTVRTVLETYANVHRGSGYTSMVSTYLYEHARGVVLDQLGLDRRRYIVVFCSPRQAEQLQAQLPPATCRTLSSQDVGLPLGLRAIAVPSRALPRGMPLQPGGGSARLVGPGWVVWAAAPDRFEAGTPAVVNVIAFARALRLAKDAAAPSEGAALGPVRDAVSPPGEDAVGEQAVEQRSARDILRHDRLDGYCGPQLLAELRKTLIGQRIPVPTRGGLKPFVNLDNAASTPTFEPVWGAVQEAWRQPEPVRRDIVGEAKLICAEVLHAPPSDYEVVFTANTTEAINLVAQSLGRQGADVEPVVVNTVMEHNSDELPWRRLPGVGLIRLPVDRDGFVDPAELDGLLQEYNLQHRHGGQRIMLVALSGASNVLGACNDLAQIGRIAHRHGARLLVDGAQLVAHRAVDLSACGIDYFAFSAHKAYAPFGTGALVARTGTLGFDPAEHESIRASGEENVGGIAALGKALLLLQRVGLDVIQQEEQALTARALRGLAEIPGITVFGVQSPDSPHFPRRAGVIAFTLRGVMAGRVAAELAHQGGIGVRSGCHCAHMLVKRLLGVSSRLERFQRLMVSAFPHLELPGVTRVSLGIENTPEDVDILLDLLGRIARQPRAGNPFRRPNSSVKQELHASARALASRVYA